VAKINKREDFFSGIGQTLKEAAETKWEFIKTGSTLLNYALGGGWLRGGVAGVFGAESTGKTLLALEAAAQCQKIGGYVFYDDAAAVLDRARAVEVFSLDLARTGYHVSDTVEEFFERLIKFSWKCDQAGVPGLYVLDDLDTLDTHASIITDKELGNLTEKIGNALNMKVKLDKATVMSALLRAVNKRLVKSSVAAFLISQTRKKIGVTWGSPVTVSGGEALKFYCTQRVELATVGKIPEGDKVVGVNIRAKVAKNKVSSPFQAAEYPIYFSMGIDNVISCVDFLSEHSDLFELSDSQKENIKKNKKKTEDEVKEDEDKKKKRGAFAFDNVVYRTKDSLVTAVKENPDLYRSILKYVELVWSQKFKVC